MSEDNDAFVWQESIGREDPAPSYIQITLSTGRVLRVCQEDPINQIELGTIEAMNVRSEGSLMEKYPVDLRRRLTAFDRRFLRTVAVDSEMDKVTDDYLPDVPEDNSGRQ